MQPTRCASLRVRLMHEPLALSNHDMQESGGIEHDQSRGTGEGSNLLNSRGISQVSSVVPGARLGTMGLADRGGLQSQETRLPDPGSVRGQTAGEAARAMRHRTTPRFWERYQNLPETVPDLADKNFQTFAARPETSLPAVQEGWQPVVGQGWWRIEPWRSKTGRIFCGCGLGPTMTTTG